MAKMLQKQRSSKIDKGFILSKRRTKKMIDLNVLLIGLKD